MKLEDALRRLGSASRKRPPFFGGKVTVYENVAGEGYTIVWHDGARCDNAMTAATLAEALKQAGDGDWQECDPNEPFPDKASIAYEVRYNHHLKYEVMG